MTSSLARIEKGLARRHRAEWRFKLFGKLALGFAASVLLVLMLTILRPGLSGMTRYELLLDVDTNAYTRPVRGDADSVDFYAMTRDAVFATVKAPIVDSASRRAVLALTGTFASFDVRAKAIEGNEGEPKGEVQVWVPLSSNADMYLKHGDRTEDAAAYSLNAQQVGWLTEWKKDGRIRRSFNTEFFTRGDSRAPESAGFLGSIVGSLWVLLVALALAVPIAIMAAITLEEFARKTRIAEWLEVAINNLAAVPSIIYGLLGLSVFLQVMHTPRSSALAGGLTVSLLILPVMIIAARAAIRAVPPSMRQAATGLGATPLQVVRHHVLPYALPGIMTGTILSICRALGETAPLLMIGMVAFVADIPRGVLDPATAMPVEIYLWASTPEAGFIEKTSSGILVLLLILLLLNWVAIRLRNRSQLTWN